MNKHIFIFLSPRSHNALICLILKKNSYFKLWNTRWIENFTSTPIGQALNANQARALEELGHQASWREKLLVRHRRLVGLAIPCLLFQVVWWSSAIRYNFWQYFPDKYYMSITMVFGSIIAGNHLEQVLLLVMMIMLIKMVRWKNILLKKKLLCIGYSLFVFSRTKQSKRQILLFPISHSCSRVIRNLHEENNHVNANFK